MASLKDRIQKEVSATPTEKAVLAITGKTAKKEKYAVNVVFDGELEPAIRAKAKEYGVGVATFIKMLVNKELNGG